MSCFRLVHPADKNDRNTTSDQHQPEDGSAEASKVSEFFYLRYNIQKKSSIILPTT